MDIYQACVTAGPSKCPLYEDNASLVKARVDRLLERLKTEPVTVYNSTGPGVNYAVVDYALAKNAIFRVLYNTHTAGALLVNALATLEEGGAEILSTFSDKTALENLIECTCPATGETHNQFQSFEVTFSIACSDRLENRQEDLNSVRGAYEEMAKTSSFAEVWISRVACSWVNLQLRHSEIF